MKHAVMFRQQVITNLAKIRNGVPGAVLNFNIAALGYNRNINDYGDGVEDDNELYQELNDGVMAEETFDNLKHELDLAFGGQCESSDDEDDALQDPSHLFSYVEKRFTEDDISDDIAKIIINEPDEMRERKCEACRRRFMLKESFEQHLKECIELKLLKFITENHHLLTIRTARTISAHDYVRRTIFSLKKLVKSLALCYMEVTDVPPNDDVRNMLVKQKIADDATNDKSNYVNSKNNWNNSMELKSITDGGGGVHAKHIRNQLERIVSHSPNRNNGGASTSFTPPSPPPFSPILPLSDSENGITPTPPSTNSLSSLISTISRAARIHQSSPIETIVAQCSPCLESFTSLALFEEHNQRFHNTACSTPSIASDVSSPPPLESNRLEVIRSPVSTVDVLNNDERNTLLERLAGKLNKF